MQSVFHPAPLPDMGSGINTRNTCGKKRRRRSTKKNLKKKSGLCAKWTIRERKNRKLNCSVADETRYINDEENILSLQDGFNYQPRVYLQELLKIKFNLEPKIFKASQRYKLPKGIPTTQENQQAKKAFTCIHNNDADGLTWLIENGFSPNYHNGFGSSVLFYACRKNSQACIEVLLSKNANLQTCDVEGRTALHHAVFSQPQVSISILKLLCDREPCLLVATDWLDSTPLDVVKPIEWPKVCSFLVSTVGIYKEDILSTKGTPEL